MQPLESGGPTKYGPSSDRTGSADGVVESVEQIILLLLKPPNIGNHLVAVTFHGLGVTSSGAMLPFGEWSLGNERPEASIVGLVGEMGQLLVGNRQFMTQVAQQDTDLGKPPLQCRPCHGGEV